METLVEILRPVLLTEETHQRLKTYSVTVAKLPMKELAEQAVKEFLDRKQTDIPS